jgi:hypothetical protein
MTTYHFQIHVINNSTFYTDTKLSLSTYRRKSDEENIGTHKKKITEEGRLSGKKFHNLYSPNVVPIYGSGALVDLGGSSYQFLNLHTVGRTPWTEYQPVARPLPTHRTNPQTSMPRVGFEPTIPVFKQAKTVHTLDRAATVLGFECYKGE